MEFHEKLQELRKQKGLTQEELAQFLYVSRTAVSKWESGRGYPNIDSLKAIAKFYSVTIDELLSGEEVITIAQEDHRQKEKRFCDLMFGIFDLGMSMLLFLPFFAQKTETVVRSVSLLDLTGGSLYLKIAYYTVVTAIVLWGILELALQNLQYGWWQKCKPAGSLALNAFGVVLFMISPQPYAAVFMFLFLVIKVLMLRKKQ